jgi:hypothetical protein
LSGIFPRDPITSLIDVWLISEIQMLFGRRNPR